MTSHNELQSTPEGEPTMRQTMNVDQAAKYLGVSNRTIYRWIRENGLPCHRGPGARQWVFYVDEVDFWLQRSGMGGPVAASKSKKNK